MDFAGKDARTTCAADGTWSVVLPAREVGTRGSLRIHGSRTIEFKDVVAGELWFCSGQSNMQWIVENLMNAAGEIKSAREKRGFLDHPAPAWRTATPENTGTFSAVAFFFARQLHQQLKVPVGVINSSWGGTPIHPWMTPECIETCEHYSQMMENKREEVGSLPEREKEHDEKIRQWEVASAAAKAEGREPSKRPWVPGSPEAGQYMPAQLYNAMVHPFISISHLTATV